MRPLTHTLIALAILLVSSKSTSMDMLQNGTNACYTIRNFSDEDILQIDVVSAENPNRWYEGAAHMRGTPSHISEDKRDPGIPYSFSSGGTCFFWDTGHEVPSTILVSWRKLPPPGAKEYSGELSGPHLAEVRSRVPRKVLALARDRQSRYRIGFSIVVGVEPVRVNWILERSHTEPIYAEDLRPYRRISPHTELVCIGGDSFEAWGLKVFEWSMTGTRAGIPVPTWPHCRLP